MNQDVVIDFPRKRFSRFSYRPYGVIVNFLSLLLVLGLNAELSAQQYDDPLALLYGDEETVSIATGTRKPLHLAPSVASVVTAEDIRAMGAQSLDEVLAAVPGLHVSLSQRYSSLISIRGIHTKLNPQVLFLIDGFPITELFTGARLPTFRMPVHSIQRVEVIRGPGSAVHGADAFAGVINIVTRTPEELPELQAGFAAGSFDTREVWLQSSGEWGGWNLGLSLESLRSDGDPDRIIEQDLQSGLDRSLGTSASLAPGPAQTDFEVRNLQLRAGREHWSLSVAAWEQDAAGIGPGVAESLDPVGYLDASQYLFDLNYSSEEDFRDWRFGAEFNYFYSQQESLYRLFPPGAVLPIGGDGNIDFVSPLNLVSFPEGVIATPGGHDEHLSAEMIAFYRGFEDHRIRASLGYKEQRERVTEAKNFGPGIIDGSEDVVDGGLTALDDTTFIYIPDRDRQIQYLSLQDEWSFRTDWELTAGVRYDDYSDFGDTVNPRLALVWQTSYTLTSKLLYGRAFRAPSFSEQYAMNNPVILGNPEVDPERIDTLELSFEYRPSYDFQTRLSVYDYRVDGLIDYLDDDGLPGGSSTAQNLHDQRGRGFELEAAWKPRDSLSIAASYSWQHAEDEDNGWSIADAPQRLAGLDLRWRMTPRWTLSTQLQHVADRERRVGDAREPVADYTLVNLKLFSQELSSFLDLGFSVHNLFAEDAREPSLGPQASIPGDHPLPGRRVMLEALFSLPF